METIENIRSLPELKADTVHIWGVHVPEMLDRLDMLKVVLSDGEKEKAARYHKDADRCASISARGALRILLSGYIGTPAADIRFSYSENGKPHVTDSWVEFNVSHSAEWVVIAIGRDRAVGVDIEQIRREMDVHAIAGRFYSPEERGVVEMATDPYAEFYRIWARKEAYVKASGSTLFSELKRMSVPMDDGAERNGWYFHYLEAGSKYAAAVVTDKPLKQLPCYDFGGLKWES